MQNSIVSLKQYLGRHAGVYPVKNSVRQIFYAKFIYPRDDNLFFRLFKYSIKKAHLIILEAALTVIENNDHILSK